MRKSTWTKEDKEYLVESWGSKSIQTIRKKLNRSENSINVMVQRLSLGSFLESGEYVTFHQLLYSLGVHGGYKYKMISWVKNRSFPMHTKRVNKNSFKVVYIDEFWKWAEKNKDVLDFSKFEENVLGKEPSWVKNKRKHDVEKAIKYIKTPWTIQEDKKLERLVKQQRYSYDELSKILRRTNGAIQRRLCDLGIMDRPIKADNHNPWTTEEITILYDLILSGYGYELISEKIGRSSKAVRGKVGRDYKTENLDKVRLKMKVAS